MTYEIDAQGRVNLAGYWVPLPTSVSPEAQAFLSVSPYQNDPPAGDGPVPMWELRDYVDQQLLALGEAARQVYPVDIEEMQIAGVRCHIVRPKEVPPENAGKVLMNLHGGGFVMGSGALIEAIPVAAQAKIPVIAVDYRLAPEHPYPAAIDDALAVYQAMLGNHKAEQIGVFGSSAGGFLTAQLMVRLQREGVALPACCGVFTAGGDLTDHGDTAHIFTAMGFWGDRFLPPDHELSETRAYLGGADPTDPGFSPSRGDLSRFPPTLLVSGTRDALLSNTASFHRALRRAKVEAELYVFEAMPHAHWNLFWLPEAQEAIDVMAAFFRRHLAAA